LALRSWRIGVFIEELGGYAADNDPDVRDAANRFLWTLHNRIDNPPISYRSNVPILNKLFGWLSRPDLSSREVRISSVAQSITPNSLRRVGTATWFWHRLLMVSQAVAVGIFVLALSTERLSVAILVCVAGLGIELTSARIAGYAPGSQQRSATVSSCLLGHGVTCVALLAIAISAQTRNSGPVLGDILAGAVVLSLLSTIRRIAYVGPSVRASGYAVLEISARWIAALSATVATLFDSSSAAPTAAVVLILAAVTEQWRISANRAVPDDLVDLGTTV
jgi:hypothetical protein